MGDVELVLGSGGSSTEAEALKYFLDDLEEDNALDWGMAVVGPWPRPAAGVTITSEVRTDNGRQDMSVTNYIADVEKKVREHFRVAKSTDELAYRLEMETIYGGWVCWLGPYETVWDAFSALEKEVAITVARALESCLEGPSIWVPVTAPKDKPKDKPEDVESYRKKAEKEYRITEYRGVYRVERDLGDGRWSAVATGQPSWREADKWRDSILRSRVDAYAEQLRESSLWRPVTGQQGGRV